MEIDVVLIDLDTPVKSDLDILLKINEQFPFMPFVALATFDDHFKNIPGLMLAESM